ncbi:hypothetical protein [Streptomyces sp. NPDC059597]|uniref:Mu transposase domain-containing protein n=1 Tax=Streptomyces sp. NPDC059597 TaxID=3346879 RepID=UPI0036CAE06E
MCLGPGVGSCGTAAQRHRRTPDRCPAPHGGRVLRLWTAPVAAVTRDAFEAGQLFSPTVDRYGQITVRQSHYSVQVHLIGRKARVFLHASELVVYDGRAEVAWHERLPPAAVSCGS